MKGIMRKRSTTAARLQRAFSAKGLRTPETNNNLNKDSPYNNHSYNAYQTYGGAEVNNAHCRVQPSEEERAKGKATRQFIMETPVQLATGVQSQERHLFLFTDLLLVAKARSGGTFKLKEKARVSEMWLATCVDEVCEVVKNSHTSFVIGWPTNNVVATFSCVATKDLWYNKLSQAIDDERAKEAAATTIQVTHYDPVSNTDICKTLSISSTTTARECISLVLSHLELPEADESKFQLWVKMSGEESPYPLIGHELPFAIRENCYREMLQDCDVVDNAFTASDVAARCQFVLRRERKMPPSAALLESPDKKAKKIKKSPIRIHRVFRRANSKGDVTDGGANNGAIGVLFGHPLHKVCDATAAPPKTVMHLLHQLFQKGPFTVGIFRKSANARLVREFRERMDAGDTAIDWENVNITVIAALFKDFLRKLPDCLLCDHLYDQWLQVPRITSLRDRTARTLELCLRLPRQNFNLLKFFLCVLHHITKRASENMMSASNLAVCVGPSLLCSLSRNLELSPEASKDVPATIEFLIERCSTLFGKEVISLLGDPPDQDPLRLDSGAEESDSLHSLHSSGGMRRDDSSIDSLERELIGEGELSPLPRKDKMSLTNLSRDSGLTMSDTQLYTPDEEESGSMISSHSGDKQYPHHQQERINERFLHYTAPNNPNAIYAAVSRRPDKIIQQHQYDEADNYYVAPTREHTRVHITYSTPSYNSYSAPIASDCSNIYNDPRDRHCGDLGISRIADDDEGIYSVPTGIPSQQASPYVASSNFQRHDWTRRCSNLRKVSKTNSGEGSLFRSTSEESLLNKYNSHEYGVSLGAAGNSDNLDYYNKGRPLPAAPVEFDSPVRETVCSSGRESPLRRSKSAHQIIDGCRLVTYVDDKDRPSLQTNAKESAKWHRSHSTPHIHDDPGDRSYDRSYDSSTLSDDDSTPHVSRSNSRGKECGNSSLHTWDPNATDDSQPSRNSSFKSERTSSMCTVVSAGSTSTLSSNPPSYEEALNRRSLINLKTSSNNTSIGEIKDFIREEKMKSARAKQLYAESLRIYQEENTYPCDLVRASPAHAHDSDDPERPPPIPPKSDPPPPLPPKQRLHKYSDMGVSGRLKHLPPVHVEVHSSPRKNRPEPVSPPLHKTIIYTDVKPPPPPPKERTVIAVEDNLHRGVQRKNIETQTDESDLMLTSSDEGVHSSESWQLETPHVTSVSVTGSDICREGRRRARPHRRNSISQRSRSMPGRDVLITCRSADSDDDAEEVEDEWMADRTISDLTSRKDETYGLRDLKQLDPELQQEISWSVSQLCSIFGDSLNGAKVHPAPYRPPTNGHRRPLRSYHLGAGDAFLAARKPRPHSNYGEESYV